MANSYQRTISYDDPALTPPERQLIENVVAVSYADAEAALIVLPPNAQNSQIANIALVEQDIFVTAAALTDLNANA